MGIQTPSTKREATKSDKEGNSDDSRLLDNIKERRNQQSTISSSAGSNGKGQNESNKLKKKSNAMHHFANQKYDVNPQSSVVPLSHTSLSSVYFHIYVLYTTLVCLILLFVSAGVAGYFQISALKRDLGEQKAAISKLVLQKPGPFQRGTDFAAFMPYGSSFSGDQAGYQDSWIEDIGEYERLMRSDGKRSKRQASRRHSEDMERMGETSEEMRGLGEKTAQKGAKDDWMWMSSYTRVPMIALKSYCREAQLYCAANGKPGLPGPKGDKGTEGVQGFTGARGDKGNQGEKGDKLDESAIAQNLASGIGVQGPPGPKGDRGPRGFVGEMGRTGDDGRPGESGMDGLDGTQGPIGPRGPKGERGQRGVEGLAGPKGERGYKGARGERGISGMPGVPGFKGRSGTAGNPGPFGPKGATGEKGRAGHCKIQCVETRKPTTAPTLTTTPVPVSFPPRAKECSIKMIGKPVYLRSAPVREGAFMMDSDPEGSGGKVWMTLGLTGSKLIEYSNQRDFARNTTYRILDLNGVPYFGTGHVVHKGCFYYHQANSPFIVRYNLTMAQSTTVREVTDAIHHSDTTHQGFLYQSRRTFFDFNVDSNGLWLVYGNKNTVKLTVALYELRYLDVIKAVEIDITQGTKGNAFIICGKLYTLDYYNRRQAKIDSEYDLWTGTTRKLNTHFGNPFRFNTMIKYDGRRKKLLAWDANVQLSVPLLLS